MKNLRTYGNKPYKMAVVHGGPGVPGHMAPVARELAKDMGVLEPLQTKDSIEGQISELAAVLKEHGEVPVILIGHSWGAVLSYMTAAQYPHLVRKLILVGTPPLDTVPDKLPVWLSRLSEEERIEFISLENFVWNGVKEDKSVSMGKLFRLIARADSYDFLPLKDETLEYQLDINKSVGQEMLKLVEGKDLMKLGREIKCPVVAINGDYDPRPAGEVKRSLSCVLKEFKFILLEKCGHYPWYEKYARDKFYDILRKEIEYGFTANR